MENRTIGDNIRKLRENAGFSQTNIAAFLSVDQSFISKVEKGERPISSDKLEKLATLFGVRFDVFEKDNVEPSKFAIAFRGSNLSGEDLEAICAINKIALNLEFMSNLTGA